MRRNSFVNPRSANVAVYTESNELYGYSIPYSAIRNVVRRLDAKNALTSLAKVSWLLEKWGDLDLEAQLYIARSFLEGRVLERAIELISTEGRTIFFRAQIYILMKHIAIYSKDSGKNVDREELLSLGFAITAVPGLMTSILRGKRSDRRLSGSQTHREALYDLATQMITNAYPVRNLQVPGIRFILARARYIFVNIHRSLETNRPTDFVDIERHFLEATGVPLILFLNVGISIITNFLEHHVNEKVFPENKDFLFLRPHRMFENALIETADLDRIFDLTSLSIPELAVNIKAQNKRELAYDFLEMRGKPLMKFEADLFLPISISYLFERFTTGIYWIILDHLNNAYGRELSNKFTRYNGLLLQKYVEEVMIQLSQRIGLPDEKLLLERTYLIGKQELRSPDVMIFGKDYVILIEASATRLQAKQTTSLGIPKAFEDDCEKMIFHNVKSLDTFISNYTEGNAHMEGFDPAVIKHIYPVVITIEGFPQHPVVDTFLETEIRERGLLDQECVRGLSILDIQDLEYLEAYSRESLISVLQGWHGNTRRLIPQTSLIEHANSSVDISNEVLSQWSENLIHEAFNDTTMGLFGRPLDDGII